MMLPQPSHRTLTPWQAGHWCGVLRPVGGESALPTNVCTMAGHRNLGDRERRFKGRGRSPGGSAAFHCWPS